MKHRIVPRAALVLAFVAVASTLPADDARKAGDYENLVRVNVGGLLTGPWTGVLGVEFAYEHKVVDWLGVNVSAWGLNEPDTNTWGVGVGASADFFLIGEALSGVFLNTRTGVIMGEVYGFTSAAIQIGMSLGFQHLFPGRLVVRVGSGGSYIAGVRFLPRVMTSVGFAF